MSEFSKTSKVVDEIEQLVGEAADGQNDKLPRLDQMLRDTEPIVEKIRLKAADPRSTYGPQMKEKVGLLCGRWDSLKTLAMEILQQRGPELLAAASAASPQVAPAPVAPVAASRASWMTEPTVASAAVPTPAQMDNRARQQHAPMRQSITTTSTPTAAERREQAARAAEARLGGASSSSSANPAQASSSSASNAQGIAALLASVQATGATDEAMIEGQKQVLTMESLLHLVHCVFLGHGFARADIGDNKQVNTTGVHRVKYTHQERTAVIATYVPVQRHLLVYAYLEDVTVPTRVALCLGMAAASVQAKTDYLLVYPLIYHFCSPTLPNLPVEVTFSVYSCLAIPALATVGVASKGLARAVLDDDVLWWRVLLNLPQSPDLRSAVDSALRQSGQLSGQALPAGECRRLVRFEVIRFKEEEERRHRQREEMERAMRDPLRVGPPQFPRQPFPGGQFNPFGGRGQIGGDHDLFPGGGFGDPFGGGGRRGPFGGGGGGFGPRF